MSVGRITPRERERIIELLRTVPIAEARRLTGRSFGTLAKIAEAVS